MSVIFYKNLGETPLQALGRLRLEKSELKNERLSYAGRLDPMAEGLLLVLVGDECNQENRQGFLGLEKEYEIEVLFGLFTDSYDLLGIPNKFNSNLKSFNVDSVKISVEKVLNDFVGNEHGLTYPPFSSKTVKGKSLIKLALADEIDVLPKILGSIHSIVILEIRSVNSQDLLNHTQKVIASVQGDFRQDIILDEWSKILEKPKEWPILKLKVSVDSGVYMRSLANSLGQKLGVGALAYSIKRTKIGGYQI